MNSQHLSPIMITLLTALALYFPLSNVLPQAAQQNATMRQSLPMAQVTAALSTNGTPSPGSQASAQGKATELLCDFFGLKNRTADKYREEGDYCALAGSEGGVTQDGKKYQVGHLMATIPDPQDSRLDYLFDYHLDAMQRALENAGSPGT